MKYYICQISGRQYLVEPDKTLLIDKAENEKRFKVDRVLLKVDDEKTEFGTPYLKSELEFEVLGTKRQKIRVATYKAKSNHRRVVGSVHQSVVVKLIESKTTVKSQD